MIQKLRMVLICLLSLTLASGLIAAEQFSILMSATTQGEVEPCG